MTKFLNISTDNTLGGNSPSDDAVSSQKAIKAYVDSQTGTAPAFANITGQPTDNTNLASALNAKYDASNPNGYTSNVGTVTSVNNVSPVNGNVTLSIPTVDQTYSASSTNAQSGTAVASAISGKQDSLTAGTGINITSNTISADNIVWVTYNTDTYATITTAMNANKVVLCKYNNMVFQCVRLYDGTMWIFTSPDNYNHTSYLFLTSANVWSYGGQTNVSTSAIVQSVVDYSTSTNRIPSTKAVYDALPTVNNATLTITQGGTTKGTFTANASSNVTIDLDAGGGSSRNIGEIVQSTIPLTDAGLHLLDGSVINGAGSYADFVTHIAGLVSGHSELFTTEANWQTSSDNYGACDKFVYDSTNNTVRLPKRVTDHGVLIKSYSSGTDWYRIYSDGWCEQGGIILAIYGQNTSVTLLKNYKNTNYQVQTTYNTTFAGATGGSYSAANLKTTSSFAIGSQGGETAWQASGYTDISDLQQTPVYEYIVVANTVKTPVEVDIDEVMTDLNGKADVDLSNMNPTQTVKNTIVGWGMPDYTAGVAKTWNTDITTTQDVRVCYGGASQNQVGDSIRLYINNNLVGNYIIASAGVFMQWVDIPAGVTYKVTGGQWGQYITEYPFLGE